MENQNISNLPTVEEVAKLVAKKMDSRLSWFQAEKGDDDDEEYLLLTIGAHIEGEKAGTFNIQTGDNCYDGVAYGYPHWGVATAYRTSDPVEVAHELLESLQEVINY